jgi:hypothetical protein
MPAGDPAHASRRTSPITVRSISSRARGVDEQWARHLQDVAVKSRGGGKVRRREDPGETWHQVLVDSYVARTPI